MKESFFIGICKQCQQLTDECTCPARFDRQKIIEAQRAAWIEKRQQGAGRKAIREVDRGK